MIFGVAQRIADATRVSGRSMLRAGRLLANSLGTRRVPTPQQRANRYLARMPISVITG